MTNYGKEYNPPEGIDKNTYYIMVDDLINYFKDKKLSIEQAYKLFIDCSDIVSGANIANRNNTSGTNIQDSLSLDAEKEPLKLLAEISENIKSISDTLIYISNNGIYTKGH